MLKKYKNRKSKRKVATVAGVKRIINNTMQSRQSSNMQIVQNTGGDYYFLATLSPDIEETGQSSIRSIDVGVVRNWRLLLSSNCMATIIGGK